MSNLVYLDAGHGGTDSGAVGQGFYEKERALTLTKMVKELLEKQGVPVRLTRSTDVFVELKKRAELANSAGAKLFVSFHLNAGGGEGYETFTHTSRSTGSVKLQNLLHDEAMKVLKPLGFADRGKKNANLSVTRNTKMPAVLTENGFIDSAKDMAHIGKDSVLSQLAEAYAKAILAYLGLTYKPSSSTCESTGNQTIGQSDNKSNSSLTYVQIGAFSDEKNAKALAEEAKKAGFNVTLK